MVEPAEPAEQKYPETEPVDSTKNSTAGIGEESVNQDSSEEVLEEDETEADSKSETDEDNYEASTDEDSVELADTEVVHSSVDPTQADPTQTNTVVSSEESISQDSSDDLLEKKTEYTDMSKSKTENDSKVFIATVNEDSDDVSDTDDSNSKKRADSMKYSEWRKLLNYRTAILSVVFGVLLAAVLLIVTILGVVEMLKISRIESLIKENKAATDKTNKMLRNEINTLQDRVESTDEYARGSLTTNLDSIQADFNRLQVRFHDSVSAISPGYPELHSSCAKIRENDSTSRSGFYFIKLSSGQLRSVYCDMESCGDEGWTRVASLDVNNCPAGFMSKQFESSITTCVSGKDEAGCTDIIYSTFGVFHSKICGRVRAYSVGTPDTHNSLHKKGINETYLDGISITSNYEHVWSFFAGKPCDCNSNFADLSFISTDWICDVETSCRFTGNIFCNSLLFSTQQCGASLPMFHKDVRPGKNNIRVRVCRDQARQDEDIALKNIELYML